MACFINFCIFSTFCYWANLYCSKWPKIDKITGYLVTLPFEMILKSQRISQGKGWNEDLRQRAKHISYFLSLSLSVRPDVAIKSSQIVSNSCPKGSHSSFYFKSNICESSPKRYQIFGLHLWGNSLPKHFKNSPIWSHWTRRRKR